MSIGNPRESQLKVDSGLPSNFWRFLAGITLGIAAHSPTAHSFSLTPMSTSLELSGPAATRSFQVQNTTSEPVAIEASLALRKMDENGVETQERGPELKKAFLLYPPQMVLKPGEKRTIRLSYIGEKSLTREAAYRLIVEQLPVQTEKKDEKKGASIRMLLKYVAAIYVSPPGARPAVQVREARLVPGKKPQLELMLENTGTAHQSFTGTRVKVRLSSDPSRSVELPPEELPTLEGQNILAGQSRKFLLPWPATLPKAPVQVTLETRKL